MPIAILDYGSQYTQLIARRIRSVHVYCEIFPWDQDSETVLRIHPDGFILSGGPASVYEDASPIFPSYVLESGSPVLGICYGMQLLAQTLGGRVDSGSRHEYGSAEIEITCKNPLLGSSIKQVWMSHGDRVSQLPSGFDVLAYSNNGLVAGMGSLERGIYGIQFHPEVAHTLGGEEIISNFVLGICKCKPDWTPLSIRNQLVEEIRDQVGNERILAGVSGGVDSTVASLLVFEAVGSQMDAVFIDTGFLRRGEADTVRTALQPIMGDHLHCMDASADFLSAVKGVTNPEQKRLVIGEKFIRTFEEFAASLGSIPYLLQGTIYPDVIESSAGGKSGAARIKSHHNVGGLPPEMDFQIIEPLKFLFKDEIRLLGELIGLPEDLVWRQPFPGPGLAVRCLGEINEDRLEILRTADNIFCSELSQAGLLGNKPGKKTPKISQAFAVLLPVKSVGVMGDRRTYEETIALRAVATDDFMTADWSRLPPELLAEVSNKIVNQVRGVNRVVYDITSKPPATIEWE